MRLLTRLLAAAAIGCLILISPGCPTAAKQKVIVRGDAADPVISFAMDEISSFLGKTYLVTRTGEGRPDDWTIDLTVDKSMKDFSFAVEQTRTNGSRPAAVALRGPNSTGVLHAVYTMLEKTGMSFDVTGPIVPAEIKLENLRGFSSTIEPAVDRRGIRQHINFPMDISSYPLDEAKAYIRNLARLRMNYLTLHTYPGQWYPYPLNGGPRLAGNFFYGQRHDVPDDPLIKRALRNSRVFCIPEIEPFYDQPEEKSRRAMEWLEAVIREAKRVGLAVNFSMELREKDPNLSLAFCESVLERYPEIDSLEIITGEDTEKPGPEIEYNTAVIRTLREKWSGRRNLEYGIGIYNTGVPDLKPGFEVMRRVVPRDIHLTVLPAHGARVAVKNLEAIPITADDVTRTVFYSWVEFDGLMYLQQNSVEGIRELIEEGRRLSGGAPLYGVCWNHWRTSENRTSIGYAAAAMIEGPIPAQDFYFRYGRSLGIGNLDTYGSAMAALDEADSADRNTLFNIAFSFGGYWRLRNGLANYGRFKKEQIEASILKFEAVLKTLTECAQETPGPEGKSYLAFLANRISCTLAHLRSFDKMAELQPLFKSGDPKEFTDKDRKLIRSVCDQALTLQNEYLRLHAGMIRDRGCEGTLISYYYAPLLLLKQIRNTYGGESADLASPRKSSDAPPAPAEKIKK